MIYQEDYVERVSCKPVLDYPCHVRHACVVVRFLGERSKKMATGKSCSRWFAPLAALLMVVSLSGCFDKEGDQRKAFIDFLQNTVMRSGERLPTLTADQKNSLVLLSLITRFCMVILSR